MINILLLIILGINWATGFTIAGYCISHGVTPQGYSFWQSFGPAVMLFILQFIIKNNNNFIFNFQSIKYIILSSITGIFIPNLLIYILSQHIAISLLTVISNLSPLFIYFASLFFKEEKFNIIRFFYVFLGTLGVILLFITTHELNKINSFYWMIVALLIPLCYSICVLNISKYRPKSGNSLNYAFGMLLFSSILNLPLIIVSRSFYILHLNNINSWLIIIEIILSCLGYYMIFEIIKRVKSVFYSIVNLITAIVGIFYGYFIFNQNYSVDSYISLVIIILSLIGISISQYSKNNI